MRVKHPRLASLILLLVFSAVVGGYLWWGRMHFFHGAWAAAAYGLAVGTAILGHIVFQDSRFQLGWRLDNLQPAGIRFGTFTVIAGTVVACAGWFSGRTPRLGSDALIYLVWAALQQYFLQDFLLQRAANVCFGEADGRSGGRVSKRSSMEVSIRERTSWSERWCPPVLAAAVFGLLHLPNYALAALTFSAGVVWCRLFRSTPNLPAVWLSHA
ncbi:MAG TPA: CPBP family intramembrane metalloprotease, partial [Acidobacteriota bacterium]|nr:CPBP family intramembrane metalloprotease [Acidobacteriota bacterium]